MQLLGGPAWHVEMSLPEVLQFAAHVGREEGFTLPGPGDSASRSEAEWRDWWESVVRECADMNVAIALLARAPEFEPLADKPLLQGICRARWDGFLISWRREGRQLGERVATQTDPLQVQDVVSRQERSLGRRSRDFHWRLDFTWWPGDYHRDNSANHTVLGSDYLEPSRLDDLRAIVEPRLLVLV